MPFQPELARPHPLEIHSSGRDRDQSAWAQVRLRSPARSPTSLTCLRPTALPSQFIGRRAWIPQTIRTCIVPTSSRCGREPPARNLHSPCAGEVTTTADHYPAGRSRQWPLPVREAARSRGYQSDELTERTDIFAAVLSPRCARGALRFDHADQRPSNHLADLLRRGDPTAQRPYLLLVLGSALPLHADPVNQAEASGHLRGFLYPRRVGA